jgi:anti-anti-sigma factor
MVFCVEMSTKEVAESQNRRPLIITIKREELDVWACEELEAALEPSYEHPDVIIDLSAVRYIDSSCLGKLANKRRVRMSKGFAPARIVVSSVNIRRIFNVVGFHEVWPMFDTLDEALEGR